MPSLLLEIIQKAQRTLFTAGVDNPSLDARWLIGHALHLNRVDLLSQGDRPLTGDEEKQIETLINRRANHEPVSRILAEREFWGLTFHLNEDTLDPRADSETLIETAVKICKQEPKRILDIGTGTGCLLLSLLHEFPFATGVGADISLHAIEQAKTNAKNLKLADRASFIESNWLSAVTGTFDLVISNPPYIPSTDIPNLMPEVRLFDPLRALDGGEDGIGPYRIIVPALPTLLNPKGHAIFEVGIGQAQEVADLLDFTGLTKINITRDLGGIERCVSAQKQA